MFKKNFRIEMLFCILFLFSFSCKEKLLVGEVVPDEARYPIIDGDWKGKIGNCEFKVTNLKTIKGGGGFYFFCDVIIVKDNIELEYQDSNSYKCYNTVSFELKPKIVNNDFNNVEYTFFGEIESETSMKGTYRQYDINDINSSQIAEGEWFLEKIN